jgi:hypothetical protein
MPSNALFMAVANVTIYDSVFYGQKVVRMLLVLECFRFSRLFFVNLCGQAFKLWSETVTSG